MRTVGYHEPSRSFESGKAKMMDDIAETMVHNARSLELWWRGLGRTSMDVTTFTLSLGLLSFLTAILCYLVISRRLKDSYLTLAIWIIPEWVTAVTNWMMAISKAVQEYALMGSYLPGMVTGTDVLSSCLAGLDCIRGRVEPQHKPLYTANGCVGTGLSTANVLIQEGVLCALVLFFILPEHDLWKVMRGVVVAPFLAACVSAVLHVQKVCWPGDIVSPSGLRITRQWENFNPKGLDPTTGKLTQLSHMVALGVLALWVWKYRNVLVRQLNGSTENGYSWVRPLLYTCVLPPAIINGLTYLKNTYYEGSNSPVWVFFLFSAAYSFLPRLMGMWPGVMMICWRLAMPENILPITQGKEDVSAVPPRDHKSSVAVE